MSCFAYNKGENWGFSFGLINLQFVKDDKPFGGRTLPKDDFKPIEGAQGGADDFASDDIDF